MLKLLGIVMVIGVCAYLGVMKKKSLSERGKQLQLLVFAVQNMINEVSYGREPMNVILQKIGKNIDGIVGKFFLDIAADLEESQGKTISEIWQFNLSKYKSQMAFEEDDYRVLKELGYGLGISHTQDQLNKLKINIKHLEQQLILAKEKYLHLGKIFQTLGWCVGLVLVLLLV